MAAYALFANVKGVLNIIIGSSSECENNVAHPILGKVKIKMTATFFMDLIGDRGPIIVNISHESKSVGNSEAAIWQWICLIG